MPSNEEKSRFEWLPSDRRRKAVISGITGQDGSYLAELLLPYGFREPLRKAKLWALRYFLRPRQVSARKLLPLYELMKGHGMLFPQGDLPIRIHTSRIPDDFLDRFRGRDCSTLDCAACGVCETIARDAVEVDAAFREEFLGRFREAEEAMASGGLWGV